VLYDARGHARSVAKQATTAASAFDLAALVADLHDVIEGFGATRVILGGLSLGAATALAYALEFPERVSGLLLAAYPSPSAAYRSWAVEFAESIERDGLLRAGDVFVWGESSRFDSQAKALIRQGFLEHSPAALTAILRQTLAVLQPVEQLGSLLCEVRIPTRIVVGADDAASVEPCRQLARLIPHANLSVLEGAGHVVNLERVTEFNEELTRLVFQTTR
jgi:pimeloyl-ACP methyl ester carboxylesterase